MHNMDDHKTTRELVFREVKDRPTLLEHAESWNQSIGYSLTPVRFRGGFNVSTSWLLFGLIFVVPDSTKGFMMLLWVISWFVRFK